MGAEQNVLKMVSHTCTKSAEIDKLDKAVFNSGHGLLQNTATILEKVNNFEGRMDGFAERMDGLEITGKDTATSMHLIEISVARIEQKMSDRKDEEDKRSVNWWQTVSTIIGIGGVAAAFIAIFLK